MSVTFSWGDLSVGVIDGTDTGYLIDSIEGWEDLPTTRQDSADRANAHGAFDAPVWASGRTVTIEGRAYGFTARDALLQAIAATGPTAADLTGTIAGRTLTARTARLTARSVSLVRGDYASGIFEWALQFRCAEPLRYGTDVSASTGYPTAGGGLEYPLTYALDYGSEGDPGRVFLENPGTAPAPVRLRVDGPVDVAGFEVAAVELGRRLRYEGEPVLADQWLDLDLSTGTVRLNGTSDRRANLTVAEWFTVPRQGSLAVQFAALGAPDPAALLTATTAPAYW